MAERIPQSTSYLVVFRAYLASDGKTPATGKTIAITISKNGATSFSNPNAGATNATEMASGFYKFTLDTTDTGTKGPLAWRGAHADINDAGDVLSVVDPIPTAVENADALLDRNVSGGSSSGRLVKEALHFLRNKWTVSGGTLTVYDTDDSTTSWTGSVSSDVAAEPIIGNDPS